MRHRNTRCWDKRGASAVLSDNASEWLLQVRAVPYAGRKTISPWKKTILSRLDTRTPRKICKVRKIYVPRIPAECYPTYLSQTIWVSSYQKANYPAFVFRHLPLHKRYATTILGIRFIGLNIPTAKVWMLLLVMSRELPKTAEPASEIRPRSTYHKTSAHHLKVGNTGHVIVGVCRDLNTNVFRVQCAQSLDTISLALNFGLSESSLWTPLRYNTDSHDLLPPSGRSFGPFYYFGKSKTPQFQASITAH